jgi:NADPH-dependent glutamate synthase beta subunit-like oxidoreductase
MMTQKEKRALSPQLPRHLPAPSRTRHFQEVNLGFTAEAAELEASRCILCKEPRCVEACCVHNDIPRYLTALAAGDEAGAVFLHSFPLTGTCGRVCYRPCESACPLGQKGTPIAISALERFAADRYFDRHGPVPLPGDRPASAGGAPVAIVGSGPAGLICAYDLARAGHRVHVIEAAPILGGMLNLGIPSYRLPRPVIGRELGVLRALGVTFEVRRPIDAAGLARLLGEEGFAAVFVGIGAHRGRKLGIPGEGEVAGVLDAVTFLRAVNLGSRRSPGRLAIVVGGGDSAIDAARTAVRLGSTEVTILYRRTRAEMPANPGELEEAEQEGVRVELLAAPVRLIAENGALVAVECQRMRLGEPDSSGRPRPVPIPGSEFTIPADCLIGAISQDPDVAPLASALETTRWSTIVVNDDLATPLSGVFAGGDAVSGPRTVGEAMAMGRRAAAAIRAWLGEKRGE